MFPEGTPEFGVENRTFISKRKHGVRDRKKAATQPEVRGPPE